MRTRLHELTLAALRHYPTRQAVRLLSKVVGWALPPTAFAVHVAGIPGRIHANDSMLHSFDTERLDHYRAVGVSAMENILSSLDAADRSWSDVQLCLDLPSGYGRVTRYLVQELTSRRVVVSDVDRLAMRFCAAEFGVEAFPASKDPWLRPPHYFDIIFVGSLVTHLPPANGLQLLRTLFDALAPRGILVFSSQGESCLDHLYWYGSEFPPLATAFHRQLQAHGVAFMPYRNRADYGITIHTRAYLEGSLRFGVPGPPRLIRYEPRGWAHHQDVWAYQRP